MLAAAATALVLLHGSVTIGPTTPTCKVSCTKPAAHVLLEFIRYGHLKMATTDAHGRYSVLITPGTWKVVATRGISAVPERFIVRAVTTQKRNFFLDNRLR